MTVLRCDRKNTASLRTQPVNEFSEGTLMRTRPTLTAAILISGICWAPLCTSAARAQVTIDASKITCDQFVHSKILPVRIMAAWLSGFYQGKNDNRIVDPQRFQENLNKIETFCYQEKNFKTPVMQAIEQTLRPGK